MKVLFVSPTGALGGAERVLLAILAALRQARPATHCHLLALAPGPLVERAAELGTETTVLPAPFALQTFGDSRLNAAKQRVRPWLNLAWGSVSLSWQTWEYARRLRRQVRAIDPDVIHSNGIKTHALLWLARLNGIPVLWHVHDFIGRRPMARRMIGRAAGTVAGAIAVSRAVAEDLRQLWPLLPIDVMPNAIDTESFCPGSADPGLLDHLAGLSPRSCLRVGLVATYARWKGHAVFLRAAARLVRLRPDLNVRFYLVGGPIYQTRGSQWDRAELQALARELGVDTGDIGFINFQVDVRPIYRSLDIVVHASTAPEPFGMTIIEAMACGKPVIVARAGGAAEIIRPGIDALGVAPASDVELTAAMIRLLDDAVLRSSLGTSARQAVCERFDRRRLGTQMLELLERVGVDSAAPT
jgi:glycosyltransferase involved in cell wall biosynthesis